MFFRMCKKSFQFTSLEFYNRIFSWSQIPTSYGLNPLLTQFTAERRACVVLCVRARASQIDCVGLPIASSNLRASVSCLVFLFVCCVMASDGSSAGASTSGTSPSLTDLKGIVKESLRELLHDEPVLFSRRTERRPPGSSGEDAPGGKYRCR